MENSKLRSRILMDIESLISQSCAKDRINRSFKKLHQLILKKHYSATDVSIDYHRKRIKMELVMDDQMYDPGTVNLQLATIPANFYFNNLCEFLKSCLDEDNKSLAFYTGLLRSFTKKDDTAVVV